MNRRTVGFVLLIAGVLVFLWATSQISNLPSPWMLPPPMAEQQQQQVAMYHLVQIVSVLAAIGGGVLMFLKPSS